MAFAVEPSQLACLQVQVSCFFLFKVSQKMLALIDPTHYMMEHVRCRCVILGGIVQCF